MANGNKVAFAFKTSAAPNIVSWPCTISVPKDGGVFDEQTITARFKVISGERARELAGQSYRELLNEVVVAFVDLKNEDGAAVPDEAAKASLFELPYAVAGLVQGYFDMVGRRLPKN